MGWSRVPTVTKLIRDEIVDEVISASAIFTKTIALGHSFFTHGWVLMGVPGAKNDIHRRKTALVYFTTTESEAVSQASELTGMSIDIYDIELWAHKAYFADADSLLAEDMRYTGGEIRLNSAVIDGSDLELEFENVHVSTDGELALDLLVRLERFEPAP